MKCNSRLSKYLEYIKNTGGSPSICQFDEDWEPIGQCIREDMKRAGLISERDGRLHITVSPANVTKRNKPCPHWSCDFFDHKSKSCSQKSCQQGTL